MQNGDFERCETPNRPYLLGTKPDGKTAVLIKPNCGLWTCPYCAQQRKSEWFLTAYKGVTVLQEKGLDVAMISLTSRGGKGRTRARALESFLVGFPKLRKKAVYRMGTFSYIAIPEQHKNGIMHLHVLCNNLETPHWWHDAAYKSGLGYQADVRQVDEPGKGAFYVAKYIDKHLAFGLWPKGFRRVRTSQDWPRVDLEPESDADWEVFQDWGKAMWRVHMLRDYGITVEVRCEK